jgi:hypothetical protein
VRRSGASGHASTAARIAASSSAIDSPTWSAEIRWRLLTVCSAVRPAIFSFHSMLRTLTMPAPAVESDAPTPAEPEDVEDLDVYLVCGECGTELKVSRLGELQIPRHCGERMQVVQRPEPA